MKHTAIPMRQRILDVAAKLFAQRGFSGTSIRDIAAELDIANPSIYHHFKSKEEILEQLLIEPQQRMALVMNETSGENPEESAAKLIDALLGALEAHGGIALAAMREAGHLSASLDSAVSQMQPAIHAAFCKLAAQDNTALRAVMAVAAVQSAMQDLTRNSKTEKQFVTRLAAARPAIIALAVRLLREPLILK
jgi:AcrR family transcriptional regulator